MTTPLPYLSDLLETRRRRRAESTFLARIGNVDDEIATGVGAMLSGYRLGAQEHAQLRDAKVGYHTHVVTQRMQERLARERRRQEFNASRHVVHLQRAFRESVRFYHQREGHIHDIVQQMRRIDHLTSRLEAEKESLYRSIYGEDGEGEEKDKSKGRTKDDDDEASPSTHGTEAEEKEAEALRQELLSLHAQAAKFRTEIADAHAKREEREEALTTRIAEQLRLAEGGQGEIASMQRRLERRGHRRKDFVEELRERREALLAKQRAAAARVAQCEEEKKRLVNQVVNMGKEVFQVSENLVDVRRGNDARCVRVEEIYVGSAVARARAFEALAARVTAIGVELERSMHCSVCKQVLSDPVVHWRTFDTYCAACVPPVEEQTLKEREDARRFARLAKATHAKEESDDDDDANDDAAVHRGFSGFVRYRDVDGVANGVAERFVAQRELFSVVSEDMERSVSLTAVVLRAVQTKIARARRERDQKWQEELVRRARRKQEGEDAAEGNKDDGEEEEEEEEEAATMEKHDSSGSDAK